MATRQVLPQELWLKVLNIFKKESSLHDLVFQWTTLRHVSKSFQGEIEKHFERAHLPSLRLHLATSRAGEIPSPSMLGPNTDLYSSILSITQLLLRKRPRP